MPRHEQLDDLLDRWEEHYEQGKELDPEALCGGDQSLCTELKKRIEILRSMDSMLGEETDKAPNPQDRAPNFDAGRYRPFQFHAAGGLGQIFLAHDGELKREVALKRIHTRHARSRPNRQRFELEAEITGRLEHPGIVPVYGFGVNAKGQPYYAMRLIRGEEFGKAIERFHASEKPGRDAGERSREFQKLLRQFMAVCEAVAYAHSRDIVHRDLKPANIMLGKYGETLVMDWGLAKPIGSEEVNDDAVDGRLSPQVAVEEGLSITGEAKGSPAYMSPEQAAGEWDDVGPPSDIYSLGATLYLLLTGKRPFSGSSLAEILTKVQRGDFEPPRDVTSKVPRALEAVCLRAMAKLPGHRYPTAKALAADIESWLADGPVSTYAEPFRARAGRWLRQHRTLSTAAAVGIMIAALGATAFGLQQQSYNVEITQNRNDLQKVNTSLVSTNTELEEQRRSADTARKAAERALYFSSVALAAREFEEGNLERSMAALLECPKDLRGWEWHYLMRLHHTEEFAVQLPGEAVVSLAISADGQLLAAATDLGEVHIIHMADGQVRNVIAPAQSGSGPHLSGVLFNDFTVAFSPAGRRLAFGRLNGNVSVYDLSDLEPKLLADMQLLADSVNSLSFSPDGKKLVAADHSSNIKVWTYEDNKAEPVVFKGHGGREELDSYRSNRIGIPAQAAFTPDGKMIISVATTGVCFWNPETAQELRPQIFVVPMVTCLAISPNGTQFAINTLNGATVYPLGTAEDNTDKVDVPTRRGFGIDVVPAPSKVPGMIWLHRDNPGMESIAYVGSELLITGGTDRTLCIWYCWNQRMLNSLRTHMGGLRTVAASLEQNRIVTGGTTRLEPNGEIGRRHAEVKWWDMNRRQGPISFGSAGHLMARSDDEVEDGIYRHRDEDFAVSADGRDLYRSSETGIEMRDITRPASDPHHLNTRGQITVSPDGSRLLVARPGVLEVWEKTLSGWEFKKSIPLGKPARSEEHAGSHIVNSLSFSRDGARFAAIIDIDVRRNFVDSDDPVLPAVSFVRGEIVVWSRDGEQLVHLSPGDPKPQGMTFDPAGQSLLLFREAGAALVAKGETAVVERWDLEQLRMEETIPGAIAAAYSRDGRQLALIWGVGLERRATRIELRDVATGKSLFQVPFYLDEFEGMTFLPDGSRLLLWGKEPHAPNQTRLILLETQLGREALTLRHEIRSLERLAFAGPAHGLLMIGRYGPTIFDGTPWGMSSPIDEGWLNQFDSPATSEPLPEQSSPRVPFVLPPETSPVNPALPATIPAPARDE